MKWFRVILAANFIAIAGSANAWTVYSNPSGWQILAQGYVSVVLNRSAGANDGSNEGFKVVMRDLSDGVCSEVRFHKGSPISMWANDVTVKHAFVSAHLAGLMGKLVNIYGVGCDDAIEIAVPY